MKNIIKMNLQLFAENGATEEIATEESKTYTQAELDSLLQSEADRRVSDALKKAESKSQQAIKEAQKLASMDASQKYEYELEQREKMLSEKESKISLMENKNICTNMLADRGIPVQLVDFVVDVDADSMNENINTLDKYFKQAVKAEVEKRLTSSTPKKNLGVDEALTRDSFRKLSLTEMNELATTNPELFKQLSR